MARYIDADKLCEALKSMASVQPPFKQSTILGVVSTIENYPTADVVPKSEVDNLKVLLEMKEKAYEGLKELYDTDTEALVKAREKTEEEVAREIFEEIDRYVIRGISVNGDHLTLFNGKNYAELKKKYIGESDVKRDTV